MTSSSQQAEQSGRPVFRFAPSPNGRLHLGHALSALANEQGARETGGHLLLRIEDIDLSRARPQFETAIRDDLDWLGIDFEKPVRRQSEHFDFYRTHLDRLIADDLVYPALLSRTQAQALVADKIASGIDWPRDPDGAPHYPGTERGLGTAERRRLADAGHPFAWRLDIEKALQEAGGAPGWREAASPAGSDPREALVDPALWGDVLLARSDAPARYHLAVVLDDALQGVTHVVRGHDLYAATAIHRLLQTLLDLPAPIYHHHRLVLDDEGRKLSKSIGSASLGDLRARGVTPMQIRAELGFA